MIRERARAVIIIQTGFTGTYQTQLLGLAAKNRLASMCDSPVWADDGCLMSYGPNRAGFISSCLLSLRRQNLERHKAVRFASGTAHQI